MVVLFLPRRECFKWPNVMTSIFDLWEVENFPFKRMLIDVGLYQLFKHGRLEYSEDFLKKYRLTVEALEREYKGMIWGIIPDYPPRWSGSGRVEGYIEKTIEMLDSWPKERKDIWMPVIHYENEPPSDIEDVMKKYSSSVEPFNRIAIAGGAIIKETAVIGKAILTARRLWPEKWIHGLALYPWRFKLIPASYVDSVDIGRDLFNRGVARHKLTTEGWVFRLYIRLLKNYLKHFDIVE